MAYTIPYLINYGEIIFNSLQQTAKSSSICYNSLKRVYRKLCKSINKISKRE